MPFEPAMRAPVISAWDRSPVAAKPPARPAFGGDKKPPKRSSAKALLLAILFSMVLHGSIFGGVVVWNRLHRPDPADEAGPEIEMVDLSKDPRLKLRLDEI